MPTRLSRRLITVIVCILFATLLAPSCRPTDPARSQALMTVADQPVSIAEAEAAVISAMEQADVAGLSCAVINDGRVVHTAQFGVRDRETGLPPDKDTVFAAASLSKTVFAWLLLLLAEDGLIDLDRPLHEYLDRPLPEYPAYADLAGDERWKLLTARTVLGHTTGFPNWRFFTDDGRLAFLADPGERFGYSGEGISLLQLVVEEITGRGLEEMARERIFSPLGMTRTSYLWQEAWEENHARPHDLWGRPKKLNRQEMAAAAGSMFTTAADYGRFLAALLDAGAPHHKTAEAMFVPQIRIRSERMFGPGAGSETAENDEINLGWCLGFGRFDTPHGRAIFHTGHDTGWQNYTVTHVDRGVGVVLLSNSDAFESVAGEIVPALIGDRWSPFAWLGYESFDPETRPDPPPPRVRVEADPVTFAPCPGTYRLPDGKVITVSLADDRLWIAKEGEEPGELIPMAGGRYFVEDKDPLFSFPVESNGEVSAMLVHIDGMDLPLPRVME